MARSTDVIRIPKLLKDRIAKYKGPGDTWGKAIERAMNETSSTDLWTLPSLMFSTKNQAAKLSMELAVQQGLEFEDRELPLKVRKVKM